MDPTMRLIMLIGFVEMTAVNFYVSVLMPYYKNLGYGSDAAGILTSILQIVSAAVLIGAGFAADRLGRKRLYIAGQIMRCLVAGTLLVTRNFAGLVVVSVLRGLASVQTPAQQAIIAGYTHKSSRATTFALQQTLSHLASFVVPVAAGAMADKMGVRVPFIIGLTLAVAATLLGLRVRDSGDIRDSAEESCPAEAAPAARPSNKAPRRSADASIDPEPSSYFARVRRIFAENDGRALWLLLGAGVANGLANGATNIMLPYTIMDRFSSAYTVVSSMQAALALGTMLVLLIGGRIADTRGRKGIVAVSSVLFPLAMIGLFFVRSIWQMYAVLLLVTMLGNISSPAITAVHLEIVGKNDRASFSGLSSGITSASLAAGSALAGFVYHWNSDVAWAAVIVLFAAGGLLFYKTMKRQEGTASTLAEAELA